MRCTFSLALGSGKKATFVFNEFQLDDESTPVFGQLIIGIQELNAIDCSMRRRAATVIPIPRQPPYSPAFCAKH